MAPDQSSEEPPALMVSVFYENFNQLVNSNRESDSSTLQSSQEERFKPVLINDEYYRIGSVSPSAEFFTVAVTLSFAENLTSLLPSKSLWPPEGVGFHFHLSLIGNPIHLQPFKTLRDPVRINERATAKIQSTPQQLLHFLKKSMPTLSVCLSCDDIPIGEASVPVGDHLKTAQLDGHILHRIHVEPLKITGLYPMKPLLNDVELKQSAIEGSYKPRMGIQVLISHVPSVPSSSVKENAPHVDSQTRNVPVTEPSEPAAPTDSARSEGKDPRNELMYAAAMELEVWKEEQKRLAHEKLKKETQSHLELLNTEYRRQVSLKESCIQQRFDRCRELEQQLEKAIAEVRLKEQQLQRDREQVNKLRTQTAAERKETTTEVERVTQRLQKEHEFKMQAERRRQAVIVSDLRQKLKPTPSVQNDDHNKQMAESQLEVTRLKESVKELEETNARLTDQVTRLKGSEMLWQKTVAEQHLVLGRLCQFLNGQPANKVNPRHEKNSMLQETQTIVDKVNPMLKTLHKNP